MTLCRELQAFPRPYAKHPWRIGPVHDRCLDLLSFPSYIELPYNVN